MAASSRCPRGCIQLPRHCVPTAPTNKDERERLTALYQEYNALPIEVILETKGNAARSTSDLYRIISPLAEKGIAFRVVDDPTIDTTIRTASW